MIKRIIGTLFTLATLAIVVFAIMNWGNYRSIICGANSANSADSATDEVIENGGGEVAEVELQLINEVETPPAVEEEAEAVAIELQ